MPENRITVEEFRDTLMEQARLDSSIKGEGLSLSFVSVVLSELVDTKLINDPIVFYWQGLSTRKGNILLFGYDYDEYDNSITLLTCDLIESEKPHAVTGSSIMDLATKALRFFEESVSKNSLRFKEQLEDDKLDLFDLIHEKLKSQEGLNKVKVTVISSGVVSSRLKKLPIMSPIAEVDTEIQLWDMTRLFEVSNSVLDYEETEIDLHSYGIKPGIPCLKVPQDNEKYQSYLCVVPGNFLAKIYREYGSQLLEGNVRSFLSTKTAVNKQIQNTINNFPSKFFVYNNGIAVTAAKVEFDDSDGQSYIRKLINMQIINGGQTTASLAYANQRNKLELENISVPMKLTVVLEQEPEEIAKTIQTISRSSNSQNKVSDADFFSNHEVHTELEKISKKYQVPPAPGYTYSTYWFYERAKGQYKQATMFMSKSETEKFYLRHPKKQLLTKTDFAKYHNTWKGKPDIVSKGAATNFKVFAEEVEKAYETTSGRAGFNEVYFSTIASVALMFRTLEKEITITKQSWYGGSYRANIITYSLSMFFRAIKKQYPSHEFNFSRVWRDQSISSSLLIELLRFSEITYHTITRDDRGQENVTQWCKRVKCKETVEETFNQISLMPEAIEPYLQTKGEAAEIKRSVKKQKIMDNEISALSMVASEPYIRNWEKLYKYLEANTNQIPISSSQRSAIETLVKLSRGRPCNPTQRTCEEALKAWNDAVALGWHV